MRVPLLPQVAKRTPAHAHTESGHTSLSMDPHNVLDSLYEWEAGKTSSKFHDAISDNGTESTSSLDPSERQLPAFTKNIIAIHAKIHKPDTMSSAMHKSSLRLRERFRQNARRLLTKM